MRTNLRQRAFDPGEIELMDVAETADATLIADLKNLRQLNRWFGSYRLIRHYLAMLVQPGSSHRFLDLCTGSGDIPRLIVDWCREHEVSIEVEALDFQDATLSVAKSLSVSYPEIQFRQCDVTRLAANQEYTGVFCSLALHHFSEVDATNILRQMLAATTGFALVADLERSLLTWLGVRFITSTVFREPMTVHDALLSVRRSFSYEELAQIAMEAGWINFQHRRFLYGRQAMLVQYYTSASSIVPLNFGSSGSTPKLSA
ncbi:MAG: methyltransferase domain-containing protein [Chthoniobacterales bacterium]